jgi:hypothetical protein
MMDVPGSDLLQDALSLISSQKLLYYKNEGRTVNDVGEYITQFASPIEVYGSFQPASKTLRKQKGVDYQPFDATLYISSEYIGPNRGKSGDEIGHRSHRFVIQSIQDWFSVDGWQRITLVNIDSLYT